MNRFPVIRLPYLAFRRVIESFEKTDVLNLAMISKKIYRLIETTSNFVSMKKLSQEDIHKLGVIDRIKLARLETLRSSGKVSTLLEVEVFFNRHLKLTIATSCLEDNVEKYTYFIVNIIPTGHSHRENQRMQLGDRNIPVFILLDYSVNTIWDDVLVGFQFLFPYFLESLNVKMLTSFKVDPALTPQYDQFSGILRLTMDFVKRTSEGPKLTIDTIGLLTNQDLRYMFDGVNYKEITIRGRFSNERNPGSFVCEGNRLYIPLAKWFTLEDLMNTKCEEIHVKGTEMTNDSMKEVIANWMDKKLEKLSFLTVHLNEDVNIELILSGVSDRTGFVITRTERAVTIERNDRKVADILFPKKEGIGKQIFEMFVF